MVKAEQAQEIVNAGSLLARVENLVRDCQNIATQAQAAGQWGQATGALREVRSSLELLAKLEGELQRAGERERPANRFKNLTNAELDLFYAESLYEATRGFDAEEIGRMKALVEAEVKQTGLSPAEIAQRLRGIGQSNVHHWSG
jgi:hypothetical protein